MSFFPEWVHVALSPAVLALATAVSCLAVVAVAYFLARWRGPAWSRALSWLLLLVVGAGLPFILARVALPALAPEVPAGRNVLVCFGEPHWNMLIAAAVPPLVGLFVLFRVRRGKRELLSDAA